MLVLDTGQPNRFTSQLCTNPVRAATIVSADGALRDRPSDMGHIRTPTPPKPAVSARVTTTHAPESRGSQCANTQGEADGATVAIGALAVVLPPRTGKH